MAIPEAHLATWSHQPPPAPSRDTYARVKGVLAEAGAPFAGRGPEIYLQGSYGNDTNVVRESDVDVVASIPTTFFHNAATLPVVQYQAFERAFPTNSNYTYGQYKAEVAAWLHARFGNVRTGSKAVHIPAGQNRRDCDVLPAFEYRHYRRFFSEADKSVETGVCFYLPNGTRIVNFPQQHAANCTAKHQATNEWFKPTVRIYKNIRNYLVERRRLQDGIAPSYFIEGMLYNVPNPTFGTSFASTLLGAHNFIYYADRSAFRCANGIHPLLGNSPVSWTVANCDTFLGAFADLWNGWA